LHEEVVAPPVFGIRQQNALLRSVYNWMMLGLFISGITAFLISRSSGIQQVLFSSPFLVWILLIIEIGLVFAISGGIRRMSSDQAALLFILFSFLTGVSLSFIFLVYTSHSIAVTFFVAGITFGVTSLYGYITRANLTSWGNYLFMGLIGIIIASIINIFLHNSIISWVVTYLGVIIFVGLTAYDTQKIRRLGESAGTVDKKVFDKLAVIGALSLYLDFINLFLLLLNIFGRGRE